MTGIPESGQVDETGSRTSARFSTSSTSTRTAVRSALTVVDGVTITARRRSIDAVPFGAGLGAAG